MNKNDDLNSEKMVEKCCSCVGWGSRSGTTKRWARPTLTDMRCNLAPGCISSEVKLCQRKPLFPFFSGTPFFATPCFLLGGPPRHAGDLEGVRVVAQHQQLVTAAERHAGARRTSQLGPPGCSPTGPAGQSPRRRGPSPIPTRSRGRAGGAGTQR